MLQSKSVRVLDLIADRGGMRYTDIQRALWEMSHPGEPMRCRAYWGTNLGYLGLLETYCFKGSDGLWHRNDVPHHNRPWHHPRISRARVKGLPRSW